MKARNINDIVKSASRSCQGRMQIIKCQSDLLLKIGFWCSVLSTSYLPETNSKSPERIAAE